MIAFVSMCDRCVCNGHVYDVCAVCDGCVCTLSGCMMCVSVMDVYVMSVCVTVGCRCRHDGCVMALCV